MAAQKFELFMGCMGNELLYVIKQYMNMEIIKLLHIFLIMG